MSNSILKKGTLSDWANGLGLSGSDLKYIVEY